MKIFESQSSFELAVFLTDAEAVLYREVFRAGKPLIIPELANRKFIIKEMKPYAGEDAPENAWHLVVKQEAAEHLILPADPGPSDNESLEENGGEGHKSKHGSPE